MQINYLYFWRTSWQFFMCLCVWVKQITVQIELYLLTLDFFTCLSLHTYFFLASLLSNQEMDSFLEALTPQAPVGISTLGECNGFQNRIPIFLTLLMNWTNFLHIQERIICQGIWSFLIQIVAFKYQVKCCYLQGTVLGYAGEWRNK